MVLDLRKQQVVEKGNKAERGKLEMGYEAGLSSWEQGQKPDIGASLPLVRPQILEAVEAADKPGFEGWEFARAVNQQIRPRNCTGGKTSDSLCAAMRQPS